MSVPKKHKAGAPKNIKFALVIVSDSRYTQFLNGEKVNDETSPLVRKIIEKNNFKLVSNQYVPDDSGKILKKLIQLLTSDADIIIFSGGTGLSKRDVTIETIDPLFDKKMPGFGELFRRISYDEIKSSAMLSRATAGILKGKVVFCIPGSPQAAETALNKLIIPESGHIMKHIY